METLNEKNICKLELSNINPQISVLISGSYRDNNYNLTLETQKNEYPILIIMLNNKEIAFTLDEKNGSIMFISNSSIYSLGKYQFIEYPNKVEFILHRPTLIDDTAIQDSFAQEA